MSRLKPKWRLLAIALGVSAFAATFYVAYAGIGQWGREQTASRVICSTRVKGLRGYG